MEYDGGLAKYGIKAINYPGLGEKIADSFGLSGAVIIPANTAIVRTSGITGLQDDMTLPTSPTEQILLAFKNVETTLHAAGVKDGWKAVFDLETYHTGDLNDPEVEAAVAAAFEKYLGKNRPTWVGVQVSKLDRNAWIEIRVKAALTQ